MKLIIGIIVALLAAAGLFYGVRKHGRKGTPGPAAKTIPPSSKNQAK